VAWELVADEYHGDQFQTGYPTLAKNAKAIFQKADEGLGSPPNSDWYKVASMRAHDAKLICGAYFWIIIADDGAAQVKRFLTTAPSADIYAVDLEAGDGNEPHSKPEIVSCFHAFADAFHKGKPTKPLLLYGASFMWNKGITWHELVEDRAWVMAWVPRYDFRPGQMTKWSRDRVVDYAWLSRYQVPERRLAMVQFTNGTLGPQPHTIAGLNRNEDLSVSLLPMERLQSLDGPAGPVASPVDGQETEVAYVVRRPDGDLTKQMSLKDAVARASELLTAAVAGDSVGIRKRQKQ
jgi:hypothetical protein